MDEIRIRDVSRASTREWTPPIGAMGGPPAHELYRDLVLYAGFRLLRDAQGNPRVALRDGEHQRIFSAPSEELREALDRFRMRRNLRPLRDQELADLTRIVLARATDPDIVVPTIDGAESGSVKGPAAPRPFLPVPPGPEPERAGNEPEPPPLRAESDGALPQSALPRVAVGEAPSAWTEVGGRLGPLAPTARPPNESSSGGRVSRPPEKGSPRYLQVLRTLVRDGGWVGTTSELSRLTGDKPENVYASLRAFRSDLAQNNIVIAPVETKDGWRWLAVDWQRLTSTD